MSTPFDKDLTEVAAHLAVVAPREWREFLAGFRKYAETSRDRLVQAPPDELQKMQGRAQQCTLLFALLEDAVNSNNRNPSR